MGGWLASVRDKRRSILRVLNSRDLVARLSEVGMVKEDRALGLGGPGLQRVELGTQVGTDDCPEDILGVRSPEEEQYVSGWEAEELS